jgi:serine/threonine-protein kinase RsbW
MVEISGVNGSSSLRIEFVRTHESVSCLEIEARMPSEVKAISPLVDQLIRLIEESQLTPGDELHIELAVREAVQNAVVHGNRLDLSKLVRLRCRCEAGKGVSIIVKDEGQGFDPEAVPDPLAPENLGAEHGRGILLMKFWMDEVSFEKGGTEVHMRKRASIEQKTEAAK